MCQRCTELLPVLLQKRPSRPLHVFSYLELPAGHLEGQFSDASGCPARSVARVQLIPDGVAVHLDQRGDNRVVILWGTVMFLHQSMETTLNIHWQYMSIHAWNPRNGMGSMQSPRTGPRTPGVQHGPRVTFHGMAFCKSSFTFVSPAAKMSLLKLPPLL